MTRLDCGGKCAPHNSSGKPFCCDICEAVPVAYHQEWTYLQRNTDLWAPYTGSECPEDPENLLTLFAETPGHQLLLACKGPDHCQREYRAASCRQFPFFPYISSGGEFIGLAYYWEFEPVCWVISSLGEVQADYRAEFVAVYDDLFRRWKPEFESYAQLSAEMRSFFTRHGRSIPLLHREGAYILLDPKKESMREVTVSQLPAFGPYWHVN